MLFNCAALASQIAVEQNTDNDECLKAAARFYQVSLGLLSRVFFSLYLEMFIPNLEENNIFGSWQIRNLGSVHLKPLESFLGVLTKS